MSLSISISLLQEDRAGSEDTHVSAIRKFGRGLRSSVAKASELSLDQDCRQRSPEVIQTVNRPMQLKLDREARHGLRVIVKTQPRLLLNELRVDNTVQWRQKALPL